MQLQAMIFDLDGVITDTSEYHYLAWQRLADEEGMPFDRQVNEGLRGVSRRASLEIILAGRPASEEQIAEMMARKNEYYIDMLQEITPDNLLPGAVPLLQALRAAGIKVALGSASKNARTVLDKLGIDDLLDAVADGYSVERTKPAPDLFLKAAEMLGVTPSCCAVVEDAGAGVDAALAAGMWAVGLGPVERVGHAHARFDSLEGVTPAAIAAALENAAWTVAEAAFDPEALQHKETVFTTGNGAFCLRGAFEEGYPGDMPACFVHRLWDDMPINFTELANIPRWWGVDLWIDGARFRLDRGTVLSYYRQVDLRSGLLSRTVRWQPHAGGPIVELHFERFASLADAHLAVVRTQVRAIEGGPVKVRVRTGIDDSVENTGLLHWRRVDQGHAHDEVYLHVRTRATQTDLAVATAVTITGAATMAGVSDADGQPALERYTTLANGETLMVDKFVGIVGGFDSDTPVDEALAVARAARHEGVAALRAANDAAWAQLWDTADVVVEGDIEAQIALRFNIFQLLIAAPQFSDRASIGAKTLSGFGYRHHVFWDTEIFILPLFTYALPGLARHMLMYRWHNLPGARAKAAGNGYEGAQFPWESGADGREVTPTWVTHFADPTRLVRIWTGDIEIHITADVAYAAMQHWHLTRDDPWFRDYGAEIVLDGAKFWASAAKLEDDGYYHYRNVIGPDEYHDRIDDNVYTNVMAKWHLQTALDVLAWLHRTYPDRHAALRTALDLDDARLAHWAEVIDGMFVTEDPESGLLEQFSGYWDLATPDFDALRDPTRTRSMQAILDIEGCAETQILKQPDVLMLMYLLPERFSDEQVRANYDFYDPRTDHEHGSSLGPSISAIMACRVGDHEAGYQHFLRAARADLLDVRHNAGDGIHAASAGGLWQAAVLGFGGLRITHDGWSVQPELPAHWTRLAFKFYYGGELQTIDING